MTDTRYWSKDFMINFIEEYKSNPCLWKIRSKEYTNKNLKNDAYEKLVKLCQSIYPEANRDFVVKKIQSLRGSFRKELKKVESSKRSGSSTDDVYVPSLWYFDLLLFTKDQELPTASISNIPNTEDNQILEEDDLEQDQEASVGFSEELVSTPGNKENIENTEVSLSDMLFYYTGNRHSYNWIPFQVMIDEGTYLINKKFMLFLFEAFHLESLFFHLH